MQSNTEFHLARDGVLRPPDAILQAVFPQETAWVGRGGDEVNGLSRNTVPVGVIQSGVPHGERDRVFHLVEQGGEVLRLRVCLAMPGEDYESFAVVHNRAAIGSPGAQRIVDKMRSDLDSGYLIEFPVGLPPTLDNAKTLQSPLYDTSLRP